MPSVNPPSELHVSPSLRSRYLLAWARHGVFAWTRSSAYRKFCRRNRGAKLVADTRHDFKMLIEIGDSVDNHILIDGEFEPLLTRLIKEHSPTAHTFVDVGCNIGYFSCLFSRWAAPDARCISIDANPSMIERCQRNLLLNDFRGAVCENVGVAAEVGTLEFHVPENRHSLGSFGTVARGKGPQRSFQVATRPLNDILLERGLADVDILKIDIEGFEPKLFQGLDVAGKVKVNHIFFEYCPANLAQCGFSTHDVWHFPWWRSYRLSYLDDDQDRVVEFDDPSRIPAEVETVWATLR